ncbi:MAG: multidrug transporter [Lachnospiraceae bacterium]|jgi:drug/metabolite transporter (DMT)-like permease|nr:multidrug transporter [Lachnospiraceae bacterium]MBQ4241936.1 multidrug transporter [Lachnospiraceae bacterium]
MSAQKILLIAVILLVETSVASFASFFLKKASSGDSKIDIIKSPFFYLGGILYVVSSCLGIVLLQLLPYAVVLPLGSLTYVWTMFISRWLLHEDITRRKLLGMAVLISGVILLAVGQI